MNAVIKLGNLQYLQVLQQLLHSKLQIHQQKISLVKLPFFNLISLLLSIYTSFTQQSNIPALNLYILHYFNLKNGTAFQMYRHMQGMINVWRKCVDNEEEARLFLSVLRPERSTREGVRRFLKVRKGIVRGVGPKLMQDVVFNHQDLIALTHTIYTAELRTYTTKKIQELFMSLNKKSTHANKINGAVACEFLINCAQKFEKQELNQIREPEQVQTSNRASRQNLKRENYKKTDRTSRSPTSRSPTSRSPLKIVTYQSPQWPEASRDRSIEEQSSLDLSSIESVPKPRTPTFLVNNLATAKAPKEEQSPNRAMLNSKYSYSWQKFIKTNQEMKAKLLKAGQE